MQSVVSHVTNLHDVERFSASQLLSFSACCCSVTAFKVQHQNERHPVLYPRLSLNVRTVGGPRCRGSSPQKLKLLFKVFVSHTSTFLQISTVHQLEYHGNYEAYGTAAKCSYLLLAE